LLQQRKYQV